MKKVLKIIIIVLSLLLVTELIIFGVKIYKSRKESTYYTITNNIIKTDNKYVGVGLSDYKYSKLNKMTKPIYSKATIWEYDNDLNIKKEISFNLGYNSFFNDIIETSDGYVAVGATEMSEKDHKEGTTEAIIIKYSKDYKVLWRKNLKILDKNTFLKVKQDKDGSLLVVGQSIYGDNYIGNHTTGGAILLRYSKDGEETLRINYGGPKNGIFNDLLITDNSYIAVGVYSTNTGIIKEYDKEGNEINHVYYGLTDSDGIISIKEMNGLYYLLSTKLDKKDSSKYPGVVLIYNKDFERLEEFKYNKLDTNKIKDINYINNSLILVGVTKNENDENNSSFKIKLDKNLNILKEELIQENKTITYNKIIESNNNYIILGFTNSKIKEYKTNGLDYYTLIVK